MRGLISWNHCLGLCSWMAVLEEPMLVRTFPLIQQQYAAPRWEKLHIDQRERERVVLGLL